MRANIFLSLLWLVGISGLLLLLFCECSSETINSASSTAAQNYDGNKLRFNENGEFKILLVSDMHYAKGKDTPCKDVLPSQMEGCSDLNTTDYLRRFIHKENPDLVLFTGDIIQVPHSGEYKKPMDEVFAPMIESNIPWAAILGNFDVNYYSTKLSRLEVMEYLVGLKNTLSLLNPANLEEDESIYGWGNYNLEVAGVEGSPFQNKSVLNLYLFDDGDFVMSKKYWGWDYVHPSQISWFSRTSRQLQEAYKSEPEAQEEAAPGLVFVHVPLPEYDNITEGNMVGVKQERIICPEKNTGLFDAMVAAGDIKAAFVGHGHVNDFCGKLKGINLCYNAGFGYHGYGKAGWPRRARTLNIKLQKLKDGNWGPVKSIVTWTRLHDDQLTLINPLVLWTSSGDQTVPLSDPIMSE